MNSPDMVYFEAWFKALFEHITRRHYVYSEFCDIQFRPKKTRTVNRYRPTML